MSSERHSQAIKLFHVPREIGFAFHFWHKSFILHVLGLAELSNNGFGWTSMTYWGGGSRHAVTPPTYFQGSGPQPPESTSLSVADLQIWGAVALSFFFLRHFLLFRDVILRVSLQNITVWTSMRVWYIMNSTRDVTCRIPLSLDVEAVCKPTSRRH